MSGVIKLNVYSFAFIMVEIIHLWSTAFVSAKYSVFISNFLLVMKLYNMEHSLQLNSVKPVRAAGFIR